MSESEYLPQSTFCIWKFSAKGVPYHFYLSMCLFVYTVKKGSAIWAERGWAVLVLVFSEVTHMAAVVFGSPGGSLLGRFVSVLCGFFLKKAKVFFIWQHCTQRP